MKDTYDLNEGKKVSLDWKTQTLRDLIIQRYQSLATLSTIAAAIAGVIISLKIDSAKNPTPAYWAFVILIVVSLVSFGRYLYLLRDDINAIAEKIRELPNEDWNKPLKRKDTFALDYWPESLFVFYIVAVLLLVLAFV